MFSSPEKRIKKESAAAKSKKNSSEQRSPDKYESIASKKLNALQEKSDSHSSHNNLANLQEKANQNNTGLPDHLKQGVESLSGVSLDDVKVNYNSSKPSNLGASAYAEGNHIHVGGGQEKHLAHEAWHVVQQKQGRVNSTRELNGTSINDDSSLEKEATDMGNKAATYNSGNRHTSKPTSKQSTGNVAQLFGFSNPFSRKKIKEKYSSYSESEQKLQDEHKGGFLKGATRGVLGLGGGIIGGLGGLAKGIGHKAYNKFTGGEDVSIMDNMKAGGTAGRDAGRVAGSAIVDGTRAVAGGAMGAAGGLIGGLGGAAYGAGKKAYNKATGGEDVSIMDSMVGGAKGGFNLAANSEGSKMVMKSGVSAAAALAAAPTGAGFAAGALASKGMSGYYGETEDKQDVALASGLLGGGLGSLASGAAGTAEALNSGSTFLSNKAASTAAGTAVSMPIGKGIDATHDYVDNYGKPNSKTKEETIDKPEEKSFGEKALDTAKAIGGGLLGKAVGYSKIDNKNTVGKKLTERKNRVKKILGFKDPEKKQIEQ